MNLARFARRRYTAGPTPIERLDRLTELLGGPTIYVKRDDLLGLAGGGNKTRKLEFLVADALAQGADTLITCGAVQSNHCRLTLAAAIREGLRCRLVLEQRVPNSYDRDASGNNFLFRLLGVEQVRVVEGGADLDAVMSGMAEELEADGRKAYVIPGGGSIPLGALGYVACGQEILQQAFELGLRVDHIVCASGSGGTHAGLVAGMLGMGAGIPVTGVSVRHPRDRQEAWIQELAGGTAELVGVRAGIPDDAVTVFDDYVGPGYSLPTDEMVQAVRTLARIEGLLLDPVYTGKAMAGLIDLARKGYCRAGENVLFLHTGGSPALYAYQSALLA
ncbi:MAG: D-cysteine desulfhydrase [Gemmatimonadetes bacterium]|nr:D-cysteine desulfhydrase [Gemmatimonadota bacterium]